MSLLFYGKDEINWGKERKIFNSIIKAGFQEDDIIEKTIDVACDNKDSFSFVLADLKKERKESDRIKKTLIKGLEDALC